VASSLPTKLPQRQPTGTCVCWSFYGARDYGRMTLRSEEILPLSEQRGAAGPDYPLAGN
jgi:hypothetical protein